MADIKRALHEMCDILVKKHGFTASKLSGNKCYAHSTEHVLKFLIWLDCTPEAQKVLADLGYLPSDKRRFNVVG